MNGSKICVIAKMVPNWLLIITNRASSATSPTHTNTSLITPCCCSNTFQAEVRTKSDVQNGNKTKIISKFDYRDGRFDNNHATGYPSIRHDRVIPIDMANVRKKSVM